MNYEYMAKVERVVDGDTVDVLLDLGFGTHTRQRLRLYGIDAPEIRTRDKKEKVAGLKTTEFVNHALMIYRSLGVEVGKIIKVETIKLKRGKYGRYLAIIHYPRKQTGSWTNLNKQLVRLGLAREEYYGRKK